MRLTVTAAVLLLTMHAALGAGFQRVKIPDPGNPAFAANVWYPTSAAPRPDQLGLQTQMVASGSPVAGAGLGLIAISHGTGGNADNHYDTAIALADAGFVVVAPTHTGDSTADRSRVLEIWNRPRLLHVALNYMLATWPDHAKIDPHRIGVFGFSAGGFTALVAAGGTPDMRAIDGHCTAHPSDWTCSMIAKFRDPKASAAPLVPKDAWVHDARIRAAVVAAPALGYTFGKTGLSTIHVPVQLWRAGDDHILPAPYYADAVAADLPVAPDYHIVKSADHMDFLAPCSDALANVAPAICTPTPAFDRASFHRDFNKQVVAFFARNLPS